MKHCWHLSGTGAASHSGGSRDFRCCYCGLRAVHMYKREHIPIQGHGPLHTRTHETITVPLPDEECHTRTKGVEHGSRKNDEADDLDI